MDVTTDWGLGRCAAAVATPPDLEIAVAVLAAAAQMAARIVVCALVERNLAARVDVAKDIAAPPAVVPPHEVVEVLLAQRVVADFALLVGLERGLVSFW